MKTLILLIDFNGHKILVDEYINKLRYSTLQQIVSDDSIDRNETVICSIGNSGIDLKLIEIKKMAVVDGWKWLEINDAMSSVETIEKLLKEKLNFYMTNTDTEIVIGGCNTSGCVLKSKMSSAKYFAEKHNYKYIGFVEGYITKFKLTHTRLKAGEFTTENDGGAYVCVQKEKEDA